MLCNIIILFCCFDRQTAPQQLQQISQQFLMTIKRVTSQDTCCTKRYINIIPTSILETEKKNYWPFYRNFFLNAIKVFFFLNFFYARKYGCTGQFFDKNSQYLFYAYLTLNHSKRFYSVLWSLEIYIFFYRALSIQTHLCQQKQADTMKKSSCAVLNTTGTGYG